MHEILKEKSRVKRLSTPDSFSVFILSFKLDSCTEISNFRTVCHAGTGNFLYTNKLKKRKTPGRARGDNEEVDCFCNTKLHENVKEKIRVKRLSTPESFSFFTALKLDSSTEISIFRTVCHPDSCTEISIFRTVCYPVAALKFSIFRTVCHAGPDPATFPIQIN